MESDLIQLAKERNWTKMISIGDIQIDISDDAIDIVNRSHFGNDIIFIKPNEHLSRQFELIASSCWWYNSTFMACSGNYRGKEFKVVFE